MLLDDADATRRRRRGTDAPPISAAQHFCLSATSCERSGVLFAAGPLRRRAPACRHGAGIAARCRAAIPRARPRQSPTPSPTPRPACATMTLTPWQRNEGALNLRIRFGLIRRPVEDRHAGTLRLQVAAAEVLETALMASTPGSPRISAARWSGSPGSRARSQSPSSSAASPGRASSDRAGIPGATGADRSSRAPRPSSGPSR